MKKRITMLLTAAVLTVAVLSGCGKKNTEKTTTSNQSVKSAVGTEVKYKVASTIFPEYDWVKEIVGDKADRFEFINLFDKGVDLHSYQPTAEDIAKISSADLFVYVGGDSHVWADTVVKEATNPKLKAVKLLEVLGDSVKNEEIVEGMEHHHDHDHDHEKDEKHDHDHDHEEDEKHDHDHDHEKDEKHDHDHDHEKDEKHDHDHDHEKDEKHDHDHDHEKDEKHDHDHDHEKDEKHDHDHDHDDTHTHEHEDVKDEHVWLSLKNAVTLVKAISAEIQLIDPENKEAYAANTEKYVAKLLELDIKFANTVKSASKKTVLFGDRFPFRYLVDDYGLKYFAAFSGCSAETEASFETVAFLANKTDELELSNILVIEKSNDKIAKTIVGNTKSKNQNILELNSMQSVTAEEMKEGFSYLSVMENNLKALETAIK